MGSKRKHCTDDSPLSASSITWSTPDAQSPLDGSLQMRDDGCSRSRGWHFSNASRVKSSDWGHRTRKRVRDNRPDERSIHENTLQKLFSAQRNHADAAPTPSEPAPALHLSASKPQKSTLHSFWKQLPAPPVQPLFSRLPQVDAHLPRCDDCDASLQSTSDSMDTDMDTDMTGAAVAGPFACIDCGRNVCGTCAVVSARRHCLQCAATARNSAHGWW